ncbi:MAG: CoA transferase [Thermodesulfobacteriota bacterium]|jgi:crotonobetainyl-CoA:carnitine CoA-transferase CaiB-like acyl-CoA transferase
MKGPLAGIRVLDLTRALAGPYCTMMLGDMGAEVIKVESPDGGDDSRAWAPPYIGQESAYFLSCNRNKKSITLNLRSEVAKKILTDLIKVSDVVVENFRPGVMKKMGFPYETLKAINPRVIFCSISGFGTKGPDAQKPGFDLIAQGMSGFMSFTGEVGGGPIKVGVAIADINSGMFAAYGILTALYHRERTGEGQMIETSLFETMVAQLTFQAGRFFATGVAPKPEGNRHPLIAPYESLVCQDGYINIAAANDGLFGKTCEAIGLLKLVKDQRFLNNGLRVKNRDALIGLMEGKTKTFRLKDLQKKLDDVGVPNGPIWSLDQTLTSEQAHALEMVKEIEHPTCGKIKVTGVPVKLSQTPGAVELPPPTLGQHTEEILTRVLGYSKSEVEKLKKEKVI